ncbi:DUF4035 domain-containing protein [Escherichia coli]|uniref:phage tail assembly protein T n=1 Tax=Escherichia coli TaxID=562 RepID=UPI003A5C7BD5
MWMEFDRVSPLGDERGDIRNAQIVKAVFGAQGMNVALKDAPGRIPFTPQARPTIFCASEKPRSLSATSFA